MDTLCNKEKSSEWPDKVIRACLLISANLKTLKISNEERENKKSKKKEKETWNKTEAGMCLSLADYSDPWELSPRGPLHSPSMYKVLFEACVVCWIMTWPGNAHEICFLGTVKTWILPLFRAWAGFVLERFSYVSKSKHRYSPSKNIWRNRNSSKKFQLV